MRCNLSAGILFHCIFLAGPSIAATIHVDGSNPNCPGDGSAASPFCLIQAAIAAASTGDTVPSSLVLFPQPQALLTETHWQLLCLGAGSVGNFSNQVTIWGG